MLATGGLVARRRLLPVAARRSPTHRRRQDARRRGRRSACLRLRSHPTASSRSSPTAPRWAPGSRTSLPMVVADELEADWSRVRVKQAPGDEKRYGNQDTDGSRSLRHFFQPMRRCGAAARHDAGEGRGGAMGRRCRRGPGAEPRGRPQAERAASSATASSPRRQRVPVPPLDQMKLKDQAAFRYIGKGNVQIVDCSTSPPAAPAYGIDAKLPGMIYAVVARPPVLGGKLASYDATAAIKVPGVVKIVVDRGLRRCQRNSSRWRRGGGRRQYLGGDEGPRRAQGRTGTTGRTAATIRQPTRRSWKRPPASPARSCATTATLNGAEASAAKVVGPSTTLPYLAHASMEPPTATARVADGKSEVWAPGAEPRRSRKTNSCKEARPQARGGDGQRHPARRRLRPQVEVRLRARGGVIVPRDGRRPGQGRVDPRGRHSPRLLSCGLVRAPRGGHRWPRQAPSPGCTAASRRRIRSIFVADPKASRRASSAWE